MPLAWDWQGSRQPQLPLGPALQSVLPATDVAQGPAENNYSPAPLALPASPGLAD
jgi:hypothetical protein